MGSEADSNSPDPPQEGITPDLLQRARDGSRSAQSELFDICRDYLLKIANHEFPEDLQAKSSPSDIVQDAFLEAHKAFPGFRGNTEAELLAWLKTIMRHNLANVIRLYRGTQKRRPDLESQFQTADYLDLAASSGSPSEKAIQREDLERLQLALNRLPDEERQLITWRQEKRTWEEIGQRLGRSADAVGKQWARAVERLRQEMDPGDDHQ